MNSSDVETVPVRLGDRSYDIVIGTGWLPSVSGPAGDWCRSRFPGERTRSAFIVTDRNVARHAEVVAQSLTEAGWRVATAELEPGERTKSLAVIAGLYDRLVELKADRRTVVLAVGGGVIGDAAGFAAATYARGVPFLQVPTTLLADVDSSVGGKVGINHPAAKNLIGAFYQPLGVFIDTAVLDTLPAREYRSGLAEVVKYGVILDAAFFGELEAATEELNNRDAGTLRRVIARCCRLKADIVEQDEFERTGLRAVLNYGHTFAHAFEALCGYGELLHGEAVSIGMVYAARLAERCGLIGPELSFRQNRLLERLGLPVRLPTGTALSPEALIDCMRLDKKSVGGQLRFVLPEKIGHVETADDISEQNVRDILTELA